MTLKPKLTLILIPLVVIPIVLLGKLSYDYVVETNKQTVLTKMGTVLDRTHQQVQFHLQTAQVNIDLLLESSGFSNNLPQQPNEQKQALAAMQLRLSILFNLYKNLYQYYDKIRILLPNGSFVTPFVSDSRPGNSASNLDSFFNQTKRTEQQNSIPFFYTALQNSPNLVEVFLINNTEKQQPHLVIARKLYPPGRVPPASKAHANAVGYLLISMRPEFLTESIFSDEKEKTSEITDNGYLLITDGKGQILYQPPLALTSQQRLPKEVFSQLSQSLSDKISTIQQAQQSARKNQKTLTITLDDHQTAYIQGRQLHNDLYLFAIVPEQDVLAAGQPLKILFAIATLASIVTSFILLFFTLNYLIIEPLLMLAETSQRIGDGDLDIQLPHSQNDEFGELIVCFNRMVVRLREALQQVERANVDLEEKVRQRTLSLQKLNADLEAEREKADAASDAKTEFIANISHELRTPMNGILGMAQLILKTSLNQKQHQQLSILYQSGQNLLILINELLDLSKIEAGKMELETRPFDLLQTLSGAVDLLQAHAQEKGLDLEIKTGGPGLKKLTELRQPYQVMGDNNRLRQVVLNLLSNAIKFTKKGSVTVRLEAENTVDDKVPLKIAVIDTGIGIPQLQLPHLFDKFHQLDASTSRKYGGTGLGLYICRQLVELLGGQIGVESEEGDGCTFWFTLTLPVVEAASPLPADQIETTPMPFPNKEFIPAPESTSESGLNLPSALILLVEDDKINQFVAKMTLEDVGCQVEIANDGQEAIDMTAKKRYDLALMDIHMPILDGYAATQQIRQRESQTNTHLPIIAMTADVITSDLDKCVKAGMDDALTKPVAKAVLEEKLVKWINKTLPEPSAKRGNILLVEDNEANQAVQQMMLEEMGFLVDIANHGGEAIEMNANKDYDLILMDIHMPILDGCAATKHIRQREKDTNRRLPIIAVTATATTEDFERCQEAGMDDFLAKPVVQSTLAKTIDKWLMVNGHTEQ